MSDDYTKAPPDIEGDPLPSRAMETEVEKLLGRDIDWDDYESDQTERQFRSYQSLGTNLTTLQTAAAEVAHWNRMYRELSWESAREAVDNSHAATIPSPLTAEQIEDVAGRAARKIQFLAVERCEAWNAITYKEMSTIIVFELMAVATAKRPDLMDHNTFPANDPWAAVATVPSVAGDAESERIRICAYLGYDTIYSDEFCVRCSHCPTNCECASPIYMAGWEPDETLRSFKVALFQEAVVAPSTPSSSAEIARDAALEEAARIADSFHISNNYSGHWQNGAAMASTAIRDLIRARKSNAVAPAELAATQTETVWRDIENAPKDGTRILLKFPSDVKIGMMFAAPLGSDRWLGDDGNEFYNEPTGWQPLPPFPSLPESREP